ncbi:MAG: hypothetical protein HYX68_08895 [Planctomycetes bacterium]|jgi:hypothetical protein|nr:hypothetical protein [Planctomycetota bacterium]
MEDHPYEMSAALPTCSRCTATLVAGSTACPACGFDREAEENAVRDLNPMKRHFDAHPPLRTRLGWFVAYSAGLAVLGTVTGLTTNTSWVALVSLLTPIMILAAFIFGTVPCVDLQRDYRGKVTLSKTWHCCFFPWSTIKIPLREFETVGVREEIEHDAIDWIALIWLFSLCLLPGMVWWFLVFNEPIHQVALTKDRGIAAVILYRGRNRALAHEMAAMVSEVCVYPLRTAY